MAFCRKQVYLLSCILLVHLIFLTEAQPVFQRHYCNYYYSGSYTNESRYGRNLDTLPSSFTTESRFYNFTIGENPDRVNAIALCRGDVAGDVCRTCLLYANNQLRELCPSQKEVIGWYDDCMLRYTDRAIFHTVNTLPNEYGYAPAVVDDASVGQFNQAVRTLLDRLTEVASGGSSVQKYATGDTITVANSSNISLFGLAECTPHLSKAQCNQCLNGTGSRFLDCCGGRLGARVMFPSCNFRYETSVFYATDSTTPTENSTPQPPPDKDDYKTRNTVIIVVSVVIFLLLVIVYIWIILRKKKQRKWDSVNESETMEDISSVTVESLQYDFDTIGGATDEFSDANRIGQGGFGIVYKGNLPNGQSVAVKRLSKTSNQGEVEFKNEVLLMANLQHKNWLGSLVIAFKEQKSSSSMNICQTEA